MRARPQEGQTLRRQHSRWLVRWPPQAGRSLEVGVDGRERFEHEGTAVARRRQPREHVFPVHRATADQSAMALAHMNVAQHVSHFHQRFAKTFLLDVRLIRIRVQLDVVRADGLNRGPPVRQRVVQLSLVAVAHLQAQTRAAPLCLVRHVAQGLHDHRARSSSVGGLPVRRPNS